MREDVVKTLAKVKGQPKSLKARIMGFRRKQDTKLKKIEESSRLKIGCERFITKD